jgi:hypothetical protein
MFSMYYGTICEITGFLVMPHGLIEKYKYEYKYKYKLDLITIILECNF